MKRILVIDVGGTAVKLLATGHHEPRLFTSHAGLTAAEMVENALRTARGWAFDVVSIGFPGVIGIDGPEEEPGNLGDDWVGFDFEAAFGKPVRIMNDAAMQALGAYDGGRMLFLGLGTGVGSTLITDSVIVPLELGGLPWEGRMLWHGLGRRGLDEQGPDIWQKHVHDACTVLRHTMKADYIVLGGGNAERVDPLPEHCRRGGNDDAFIGGFLLWKDPIDFQGHDPGRWRVVR